MASSMITKKRIAKAFKTCLNRQTFEKLSVRHVMEEAQLRRQTFYDHFLDKYDLLEWIFQTDLEEQITANLDYISGWTLFKEVLHFFESNRTFYQQLFSIVDQNDFYTYFLAYCQKLLEKIIREEENKGCFVLSNHQKQLLVNYHSQALCQVIKTCLESPESDLTDLATPWQQLILASILTFSS